MTETSICRSSTKDATATTVARLGGKAHSLLLLGRQGIRTPAWFCITTQAWCQLDQAWHQSVEQALATIDWVRHESIVEASARLMQSTREVALPTELAESIAEALAESSADSFSVRSSATLEDSGEHSFAGQLDTYLCVKREDILERVRDCWASTFGERCLAYAHHRGLEPRLLAAAVIVQEMVESATSGVLFTLDPTGSTQDLIIAAGYGLGEGVVADRVETDTYRLSPPGQWTDRVVTKRQRVVRRLGSPSGTELGEVPAELSERPVLDLAQKQALAEVGRVIAHQRGVPQDVEWAYDEAGHLFILQTRPITTLSGPLRVFDNSNVVESFPGVTLPLTFSHVRYGYQELFGRALGRLGIPPRILEEARPVFEELVGHIGGRVYYDLTNWYRMFALVPGTERYLPVWEKMLGIDEPLGRHRGRGLARGVGMSRAAAHFGWGCLRIERDMERLRLRFLEEQRRFREVALDELRFAQLLELYDGLNQRLLPDWDVTLLNDGYAFIFSGLCRGLLKRLGESEDRFIELIAAGGELESVLPLRALEELGKELAARPELHERVLSVAASSAEGSSAEGSSAEANSSEAAFVALCASSELRALVTQYLERWGDRSLGELKLESPTFAEAPATLVGLVLRYAARAANPSETVSASDAAPRPKASGASVWRAPWGARLLLDGLVRAARRSIRLRESSRFDRARAHGLLRRLFGAAGRRLAETGQLENPGDVFYLRVEELRELASAHPPQAGATRALVAERKARFERCADWELPSRIQLRGPVDAYVPPAPSSAPVSGTLSGQACSAGRVRAPALVVTTPDYSMDASGQILVARSTDPGWVFLMATAAGLVVEKGSLLSHSAIVGRELGIPTVVGVEAATRIIQTGQELLVDGAEGTVRVVSGETP